MNWERNIEELLLALGYDRPAILLDDDGTLAVDMRMNDHEQLFAEFDPYGGIDMSIYDDVTGKLRSVKTLHELCHGGDE